jgi:hypothetical protein
MKCTSALVTVPHQPDQWRKSDEPGIIVIVTTHIDLVTTDDADITDIQSLVANHQ